MVAHLFRGCTSGLRLAAGAVAGSRKHLEEQVVAVSENERVRGYDSDVPTRGVQRGTIVESIEAFGIGREDPYRVGDGGSTAGMRWWIGIDAKVIGEAYAIRRSIDDHAYPARPAEFIVTDLMNRPACGASVASVSAAVGWNGRLAHVRKVGNGDRPDRNRYYLLPIVQGSEADGKYGRLLCTIVGCPGDNDRSHDLGAGPQVEVFADRNALGLSQR
jgi:hypothetical protein